MRYQVIMADKEKYSASNVSEKGSFLVLDGESSKEKRVPLSKVKRIEKSDKSTCADVVVGGVLVAATLAALA